MTEELFDNIAETVPALKPAFRLVGFKNDRQFTIGRNEGCDIVCDDISVSAHHAILNFAHGDWQLKDDDSTNGTSINGQKMEKGSIAPLVYGDEVKIRDLRIVVFDHFFMINDAKVACNVKDFDGRVDLTADVAKSLSEQVAKRVHDEEPEGKVHEKFYPA